MFVSTISVYANSRTGQDESGPLVKVGDPNATRMTNFSQYGPLKVAAEEEARRAFGAGAIVMRPGLIVGPGDDTGRFLYWPLRLRKGGDVLAPGDGKDPVQYIDVRGLVEKDGTGGTYNAIGPARMQTMRQSLEGVRKGARSTARLVWVPMQTLEQEKVAPWSDLPLGVPEQGGIAGFHRRSNRKALARADVSAH